MQTGQAARWLRRGGVWEFRGVCVCALRAGERERDLEAEQINEAMKLLIYAYISCRMG